MEMKCHFAFGGKDEKRIEILDKSLDNNQFISNDEYRIMTAPKAQNNKKNTKSKGEKATTKMH